VVSGTVTGSFFLGYWGQGPAPNLASPHASALPGGKKCRKRSKSQGIAVKSCLAKYCFSPKSIFFQDDMEGLLAFLNNQMKFAEGEKEQQEDGR